MTSIARWSRSPGFQQIVGDATQLTISVSGMAYALAPDGTIWTGSFGNNWKLVRSNNVVFKKIFRGKGVWALTADGSIYQSNDANDTMVRTNGSLRFISSPFGTSGDTYGLNFENDLFCFRSPAWVPVATPPGVKFFTISANTELQEAFVTWAIGVDGNTYRKNPSANNPAVNNFSMVTGPTTFADIQVSQNMIWALATLPPNTLGDFPVYAWGPNTGWGQVQGEKLSSITVAGSVWGVNSFGQIRSFDGVGNRFTTMPLLGAPAGMVRQPIGPVVTNSDASLVLFSDTSTIIP